MNRYGYSRTLGTGLVAIVGTLGCLMPPTIFLIIYGLITEQSIGALFMAGIFPGLGLAVLWILTIFIWAKITPGLAPPAGDPPGRKGSRPCLRSPLSSGSSFS